MDLKHQKTIQQADVVKSLMLDVLIHIETVHTLMHH